MPGLSLAQVQPETSSTTAKPRPRGLENPRMIWKTTIWKKKSVLRNECICVDRCWNEKRRLPQLDEEIKIGRIFCRELQRAAMAVMSWQCYFIWSLVEQLNICSTNHVTGNSQKLFSFLYKCLNVGLWFVAFRSTYMLIHSIQMIFLSRHSSLHWVHSPDKVFVLVVAFSWNLETKIETRFQTSFHSKAFYPRPFQWYRSLVTAFSADTCESSVI